MSKLWGNYWPYVFLPNLPKKDSFWAFQEIIVSADSRLKRALRNQKNIMLHAFEILFLAQIAFILFGDTVSYTAYE